MLSDEEIVQQVRLIKYGSVMGRNRRQGWTLRRLAKAAGCARQTLYNIVATGRMHPETADGLRHALDMSTTGLNQNAKTVGPR